MTLLGVPPGIGGFSLGVNTAPKIDCSLDEMIKNRARETQQVRQGAVRASKRNEKLAAKRGMTPVATSAMEIEQTVQKEMNTRAVRKAKQIVKTQQQQQQPEPRNKTTTTTATGGRTAVVGPRRRKKPAALTTNVEQTKVIRQIKQEGKKAAQQLQKQKPPPRRAPRAAGSVPAVTAAAAAMGGPGVGAFPLQPPRKAIQAARTALKENGVAIPKGYTLQLVPTARPIVSATLVQPTVKKQQPKKQQPAPVTQKQQPGGGQANTTSTNRRRGRGPTKRS